MVMTAARSRSPRSIVYGAHRRIAEKNRQDSRAIELLEKALDNVKPAVEVKSRRVGGATYQVPVEVRPRAAGAGDALGDRRRAQARREVDAAQLAAELLEAAGEPRRRVKKREETHRMAEANKAFAHYRW